MADAGTERESLATFKKVVTWALGSILIVGVVGMVALASHREPEFAPRRK